MTTRIETWSEKNDGEVVDSVPDFRIVITSGLPGTFGDSIYASTIARDLDGVEIDISVQFCKKNLAIHPPHSDLLILILVIDEALVQYTSVVQKVVQVHCRNSWSKNLILFHARLYQHVIMITHVLWNFVISGDQIWALTIRTWICHDYIRHHHSSWHCCPITMLDWGNQNVQLSRISCYKATINYKGSHLSPCCPDYTKHHHSSWHCYPITVLDWGNQNVQLRISCYKLCTTKAVIYPLPGDY